VLIDFESEIDERKNMFYCSNSKYGTFSFYLRCII